MVHPLELGVLGLAAVLDGIEAHAVQVAGLELHKHGGRVRFHQIDVAVEIGAALKIVGVVGQDDLLPGPPLLEDIRAGAHRAPRQGRLGEVDARQQVPGQNVQAPGTQGRGEGLGIGDPEGMVVRRLGLLHLEIVPGIGGGGLGVHHHLVGEQHVLGRERGAVLPLDPFTEMEGNGEPVRRDVPAFGQVPHQVEVAVILHQAVVDQGVDVGRGGVGGQGRQQGAGVPDGGVDE